MSFAPYFAKYNDIDNDYNTSSLTNAICWSNVVDFRWHRTTPSPNWLLLSSKDININEINESLSIDNEWIFDIEMLIKTLDSCSITNKKDETTTTTANTNNTTTTNNSNEISKKAEDIEDEL